MAAPLIPTPLETIAEAAVASEVAAQLPEEHEGERRKAGQSVVDWCTNVAYWRLYGNSCPKSLPKTGEDACRAAWLRLRDLVAVALNNRPQAPPPAGVWAWPIKLPPTIWKSGGSFGAKRPWKGPQTRYHCGVDLAAAFGTQVLAPEDGKVISGDHGWEKPVRAVVLAAKSGRTILLGGIAGGSGVKAGTEVKAGDPVATVGRYPKGDTMCHVQVWDRPLSQSQVYARQSWALGKPQPEGLIDPAPFLRAALKGQPMLAAAGPDDNGEESEGVLQVGLVELVQVFLGVA